MCQAQEFGYQKHFKCEIKDVLGDLVLLLILLNGFKLIGVTVKLC